MPMARLAEYAAALAAVLGEPNAVHLAAIEPGSTVLVPKLDREGVPKIRHRVALVQSNDDPPREARDGYLRMNRLLRDDNATAVLRRGRGTKIIEFPGVKEILPTYHTVRQHGTISGTLVRLGGRKAQVPLTLEVEDAPISGCYTTRTIARRLASHLFEPVRVRGEGVWARDADGQWELKQFAVEGFEPLKKAKISEILTTLREIAGPIEPDEFDEVLAMRKEGADNAGH